MNKEITHELFKKIQMLYPKISEFRNTKDEHIFNMWSGRHVF